MATMERQQLDRFIKVVAIVLSLSMAILGFAYGYGSLNSRVTNVERQAAAVEVQIYEMRKEFREDLRYIRDRLDETVKKEKSK